MHAPRRRDGFTLIELLVVMAIIATLASLGIVGIPTFIRQSRITADQGKLQAIFKHLVVYQTNAKGRLSSRSGPSFVLSIWDNGQVDHTVKDAEIFFTKDAKKAPDPDLGNVTPEDIDWTGIDQEGAKRGLAIDDRNANDKIIICNKVATVEEEADKDDLPYAAKGLNALTLGGEVIWFEASEFAEGYAVIGPESSIEKLQKIVPEPYQ